MGRHAKTDAIDTCLERNACYAEAFSKGALPASPSRQLAVVACMDARMEIGALLGLGEGEAHVIRNAGGVVTDDVIRSLAISQLLLGTREIMLLHHTDCGMSRFTDAELEEALWKATGRRPSFPLRTFPDVEEDVRHSFARLRASPFVMHKDAIRGFVFDVETGRLREVE